MMGSMMTLVFFLICVAYLVCVRVSNLGFFERLGRREKGSGHYIQLKRANSLNVSERLPKNTRKPEWVRQELIRLAALMGNQSRRSVGRTFNRLYANRFGVSVSSSFTCALLKSHAVQVLRLRRVFKAKQPRLVPICHTWAMDLTFFTDEAKVSRASLGILDHGSRALLCLCTLVRRNSWILLGHLCIAIGRYGKPRKLRTDNEAVFNSFVFQSFLRLVGIEKQTTNVIVLGRMVEWREYLGRLNLC